jgi:hypothetical protein
VEPAPARGAGRAAFQGGAGEAGQGQGSTACRRAGGLPTQDSRVFARTTWPSGPAQQDTLTAEAAAMGQAYLSDPSFQEAAAMSFADLFKKVCGGCGVVAQRWSSLTEVLYKMCPRPPKTHGTAHRATPLHATGAWRGLLLVPRQAQHAARAAHHDDRDVCAHRGAPRGRTDRTGNKVSVLGCVRAVADSTRVLSLPVRCVHWLAGCRTWRLL